MKKPGIIFLVILWIVSASIVKAQEEEGQQLYMKHCAQCHGAGLTGGNAQSLIDGFWQYGKTEDTNGATSNLAYHMLACLPIKKP